MLTQKKGMFSHIRDVHTDHKIVVSEMFILSKIMSFHILDVHTESNYVLPYLRCSYREQLCLVISEMFKQSAIMSCHI